MTETRTLIDNLLNEPDYAKAAYRPLATIQAILADLVTRLEYLESQAAIPSAEQEAQDHRITKLELQVEGLVPPPAGMPSSSPATERQEATPPGPSTSSETYCLVKVGPNGEPLIMATVIRHGPNSPLTLGKLLKDWLAVCDLTQLVHTMSVLPWPPGPTPSTTRAVQGGGPSAGGSTGYRRISDD